MGCLNVAPSDQNIAPASGETEAQAVRRVLVGVYETEVDQAFHRGLDSEPAFLRCLREVVEVDQRPVGLHEQTEDHVLDPAQIPTRAAKPNVLLYLCFGALAGLFLGLVSVESSRVGVNSSITC